MNLKCLRAVVEFKISAVLRTSNTKEGNSNAWARQTANAPEQPKYHCKKVGICFHLLMGSILRKKRRCINKWIHSCINSHFAEVNMIRDNVVDFFLNFGLSSCQNGKAMEGLFVKYKCPVMFKFPGRYTNTRTHN